MSRAPHPHLDLAWLINPVTPEAFKREYWEQKPLVLTGRNDDRYRSLLSLADVDGILSYSRAPDVHTVREDPPGARPAARKGGGKPLRLEGLYQEYRDGSTMVLNALHQRWPPLAELCRSLSAEFSAAFQVNVYLTPPGSQGLPTHYDTHDVFVLQVQGRKHWRLYESPVPLPLAGQPYRKEETEPGALVEEFDLSPGDLAYLPRGTMHDAATGDALSLHLTVGANTITWASVLLGAVESLIERDARFRESLPPGFAGDAELRARAEGRLVELVDALRDGISPGSVIDEATARALSAAVPALAGHLLDLEAEPLVGLATRVRRRPEVRWRLTVEGEDVSLMFHGKVMRVPARAEKDLRFVTESDEFTAADLPGELDEEGRLVLVRRLLHEGFLTIPRPAAPED